MLGLQPISCNSCFSRLMDFNLLLHIFLLYVLIHQKHIFPCGIQLLNFQSMCSRGTIYACMYGSRGEAGGLFPLKSHKIVGFLSNTGPDPLKNHEATKSAFNVWPSSARQRNAISMAFRWRSDGGPFIAVFGSPIPHQLKRDQRPPSDKTFWIRAWLGWRK